MEKFTNIKGIAAPMLTTDGNQFSMMINVDTDMIIPKQFLKTIKRTGLGKNLFHEMRYDYDDNEIKTFILNKEPFSKAKVLLAGNNFGCGSSREHAAWAMLDFGIRVIMAPTYADIFYNNCFKNGILPICLSEDVVKYLAEFALKGEEFEIFLQEQSIRVSNYEVNFEIDTPSKNFLLEGFDDIGLTMKDSNLIDIYENDSNTNLPWYSL